MAPWRADWREVVSREWLICFASILIVALVAVSGPAGWLDRKLYDWAMQTAGKPLSALVCVIDIDDASINALGRWPWSRDLHAQMLELLEHAGAKVVGYTVPFPEPQTDPGLAYINQARALLGSSVLKRTSTSNRDALTPYADEVARLEQLLDNAALRLDGDHRFARVLAHTDNVALSMNFRFGPPEPQSTAIPEFVRGAEFKHFSPGVLPPTAAGATFPIPELGEKSPLLGFATIDRNSPDGDKIVRAVPLVAEFQGHLFSSLALALVARANGVAPGDVIAGPGGVITVGTMRIPVDENLQVYPYFYGGKPDQLPIATQSFVDVLSGRVSPEYFRDRIVLIGSSAAGIEPWATLPVPTALSSRASVPQATAIAETVAAMLQNRVVAIPPWRIWVERALFAIVAGYLLVALPRLSASQGAALCIPLLASLLVTQFLLIGTFGVWLRLTSAALLLALGTLATIGSRLLRHAAERSGVAQSPVDVNPRARGLALQAHGQLDLAFLAFREAPVDDLLLDSLYELGCQFEQNQDLHKAYSVFEYLARHSPTYRDVPIKMLRARPLENMTAPIVTPPSAAAANPPANMLSTVSILETEGVDRPTLGRYRIEKILGKGSMGIVYLGRDPQISRDVAIKTMELSREFQDHEQAQVRARFFREAETAGKLNHPNIVTIFDVGEDRNLAFIAMEHLKGRDLINHTKPGQLLPLGKALDICARVADALAYAHAEQVIHRDIKPANIMYEAETGTLKVTDFGIARIADASRTRTGMVLGTPSYMSPEQLAGKKIDGRSDLFSLGVTLYQLLCGHLPFRGESMAELMFKIANEAPLDILRYNPALPDCVLSVLRAALAKLPDLRYQDGIQFADDLRLCSARIGNEVIDIGL